jgi:hypothetical protein
MKNIELQQSLIRKILESKDDQLLEFIHRLLNKESDISEYATTDFEKKVIRESLAECGEGKTRSNDDVLAKQKKWLEEK